MRFVAHLVSWGFTLLLGKTYRICVPDLRLSKTCKESITLFLGIRIEPVVSFAEHLRPMDYGNPLF